MLDIEWYREWINKRNHMAINEKANPGINDYLWKVIVDFGLPDSVNLFLFMGASNNFLKPLMNVVKNVKYNKEIYTEKEELLVNSLFICRFVGNYVCLNKNDGKVVLIGAETFDIEFMNETLEEFFDFFEIYSKMMMFVESNNGLDCDSDELTDEQIDRLESDLKSTATKAWNNYTVWIKEIESMRYLKMLFS